MCVEYAFSCLIFLLSELFFSLHPLVVKLSLVKEKRKVNWSVAFNHFNVEEIKFFFDDNHLY